MITAKPDTSIDLARLEQEVQSFRDEIKTGERWYIREKYVDRGNLDPFYILQFKTRVDEPGDDLMGEPLFATRSVALKVKRITRQWEGVGSSYWQPIVADELLARLDRFLKMYREDYLQPPGYRGDNQTPKQEHPRFKNKRFLYQVCSPGKDIIGIGSKKFANLENFGAIRGSVCDEKGKPLKGKTVELVSRNQTLHRITGDDGLFWFSRVPVGGYRLRVRGKACIFNVKTEKFGKVHGRLFSSEGTILTGENIKFYAPDDELFETVSNSQGRYGLNYLIAGQYKVKKDRIQIAKIRS